MKFRNVTDDTKNVFPDDAPHYSVAPGETTPDLDRKAAAKLIGQTEVWAAVGEAAKKTQGRVVKKAENTPAPDAPATTEENH